MATNGRSMIAIKSGGAGRAFALGRRLQSDDKWTDARHDQTG